MADTPLASSDSNLVKLPSDLDIFFAVKTFTMPLCSQLMGQRLTELALLTALISFSIGGKISGLNLQVNV